MSSVKKFAYRCEVVIVSSQRPALTRSIYSELTDNVHERLTSHLDEIFRFIIDQAKIGT
jgi:hypothetical protein